MVRAYRRGAVLPPDEPLERSFDRGVDTAIRLRSLDELDEGLIETLDTFTPLRVRIGDEDYIVYVEEWASGCITSEALDMAEEACEGADDGEDCVNEEIESWVQDEGDRIAGEEGWDGFVYTHIGADYGETTFYRKVR